MKIYKSEFLKIEKPEESFGLYAWLKQTETMTEDEYHAQNGAILEFTKEHSITKHLLDARDFNFPITAEIQERVKERFFAKIIALGEQKVAFLVPEDIFAQVSLEQVMEEETTGTLTTRYFDDFDDAKAWLGV